MPRAVAVRRYVRLFRWCADISVFVKRAVTGNLNGLTKNGGVEEKLLVPWTEITFAF